jgi:hypothetical protein
MWNYNLPTCVLLAGAAYLGEGVITKALLRLKMNRD